jgi:hypothetical protein
MLFNEHTQPLVKGHLRIYEEETGNLLLDRHNDIHNENFSKALAYSLANQGNTIQALAFGSGGVRVNASNEFLYSSPQIIGRTAALYSESYRKIIDQHNQDNPDSTRNYITVEHGSGNEYTDIKCHCTLEKYEPSSQSVVSSSNTIINEYTFNEAGLITSAGDLITHLCFYPIAKSEDITLIFDYVIRIQMV